MKKLMCIVVSVLLLAVALVSCSAPAPAESAAPSAAEVAPGPAEAGKAEAEAAKAEKEEEPAPADEPAPEGGKTHFKIGLAMQDLSAGAFHAWRDYLVQRLDIECEDRGYTYEFFETNAAQDAVKQANDIKDLLAKGVDVVFCPCLDSKAILPSVEEVHNAGALYISYCREVAHEATGAQVPDLTVNFASEEQAYVGTVKMFDIMKEDGVEPVKLIDCYGDTTDENAHNREAGMRRAMEDCGYKDLPVVTVECGHWEPDVNLQNIEPVLAANPDANCLYTSSDFLMPGIQTGLENAGMWHPRHEEGHVYISASDLYPDGIDGLLSGHIDTGVDQGCYNFAVQAAKGFFDLVEGKEVEPVQLVLGTMATNDDIEEILKTIPLWGNDYRDVG